MLTKNDLEIALIALDLLWGELYDAPAEQVESVFPDGISKQDALDTVRDVFARVRVEASTKEGISILNTEAYNKDIQDDLFSME